jgi:hypothetical protein
MSFSVRLSEDLVSVEAGATTALAFEVANRSDEADRFEIEIEGLDPEWTAVPVPSFGVEPREIQTEKIFFKPPRASESLSGNYPFVLKVRSLESGEVRKVQAIFQIKAFHHLSMEILPKKGFISPTRKQNGFGVTMMNLGNTEHTLQLFGSDPEEDCAFEFEQEQVTVGPGQQKEVEVVVTPTSGSLFSGTKLHGFAIAVRSIEAPSVMSSAQAQLEQRPLISPLSLVAMALFAVLVAFWIYMMPKPPTIEMSVDRNNITLGDSVQFTWRAAYATDVTITAGTDVLVTGARPTGSHIFVPKEPGIVTLQAVASRDDRRSPAQRIQIEVTRPEVAPAPEIAQLRAEPAQVAVNQPFLLIYKFNAAVVRAVLQPTGQELDVNTDRIELTRTVPGDVTYTIVATNRDRQAVRREVKVRVVDQPDARIISFRVTPTMVDPFNSRVTLSWQVYNAVAAEITFAGRTIPADIPRGSVELDIRETTEVTLVAYDAQRRSVQETVKVVHQEPQDPDPPTTVGGSTAGATTGATTGSTAGGGQ